MAADNRAFILRLRPSTTPSDYGTKDGFFRCLLPNCDWNIPGGLDRTERAAYNHKNGHDYKGLRIVWDVNEANKLLADYLAKVRTAIY